jgi:hypothetical protein
MEFKEKNILIISPTVWDVNAPARQLYARELATKGNQVYFLHPPSRVNSVTARTEAENLFVVDYRERKKLFGLMGIAPEEAQIKHILKLIGKPIDVVWSFDSNRFGDLRKFGVKAKVFYVDDWAEGEHFEKKLAHSADLVLTLSEPLAEKIGKTAGNKVVFQHSLNDAFKQALGRVEKIRANTQFTTGRLRCGYIGNLQSKYIDTGIFEEIICQNPTVEFHLIGPFVKESNLATSGNKTWEDPFVEFLMNAPNVRMYGSLMIKRMAELLMTMDLHLVCYDVNQYANQVANPQKIMEYFSTGKVVVSTPTSSYEKHKYLIQMADRQEELPTLFKQVIDRIEELNEPAKAMMRFSFALAHTYDEQLKRIEEELTKLGL